MNEIESYLLSMKMMVPEIQDEHLFQLKSALTIQHYPKKSLIYSLHSKHESIVFVAKGLVRSFYIDQEGEEKNAWFIKENEFVTDYPAFISSTKSNYTFQCIEDCTVVVLPKKAIYQAYQDFPSIEKYGRLIAEEVIRMMQSRIESFLFLSAKERYLDVLKRDTGILQRISISQLASYLGIERQSLTRIRKELLLQK